MFIYFRKRTTSILVLSCVCLVRWKKTNFRCVCYLSKYVCMHVSTYVCMVTACARRVVTPNIIIVGPFALKECNLQSTVIKFPNVFNETEVVHGSIDWILVLCRWNMHGLSTDTNTTILNRMLLISFASVECITIDEVWCIPCNRRSSSEVH